MQPGTVSDIKNEYQGIQRKCHGENRKLQRQYEENRIPQHEQSHLFDAAFGTNVRDGTRTHGDRYELPLEAQPLDPRGTVAPVKGFSVW